MSLRIGLLLLLRWRRAWHQLRKPKANQAHTPFSRQVQPSHFNTPHFTRVSFEIYLWWSLLCAATTHIHISGALWPGPLLRTYRFVWGIRKKAFPGGIGFRYFFMLKLDIRRGLIVGSSGRRCRCRPLKSNHSVSQSIKGGLAAIRGSQTHSRRSKLKNDKNPNRKSSSQA